MIDLVARTKETIQCWYEAWDGAVYVSFSGGLDSTVLLHLVRSLYPDVPAVFANTGLEYPEIVQFVAAVPNVVTVRPKRNFKWVLENKGYPVISKRTAKALRTLQNPSEKNKKIRGLILTGINSSGNSCQSFKLAQKWRYLVGAPFKISEYCCDIIKKEPLHRAELEMKGKPFIGITKDEGNSRKLSMQQSGHECNVYDSSKPVSRPLMHWTHQDVLRFIRQHNVPYSSVYGQIVQASDGTLRTTGEQRTGCMFCMFGVHLEKGMNRFQRMELSHPKQYKFCMESLGLKEILKTLKVPYSVFNEEKP